MLGGRGGGGGASQSLVNYCPGSQSVALFRLLTGKQHQSFMSVLRDYKRGKTRQDLSVIGGGENPDSRSFSSSSLPFPQVRFLSRCYTEPLFSSENFMFSLTEFYMKPLVFIADPFQTG